MTKNMLFTILAIIGGFVVLGWVLKLTFKLIGLAIVLGLAAVVFFGAQKLIGKGR